VATAFIFGKYCLQPTFLAFFEAGKAAAETENFGNIVSHITQEVAMKGRIFAS
jgi:hypothetical protein